MCVSRWERWGKSFAQKPQSVNVNEGEPFQVAFGSKRDDELNLLQLQYILKYEEDDNGTCMHSRTCTINQRYINATLIADY